MYCGKEAEGGTNTWTKTGSTVTKGTLSQLWPPNTVDVYYSKTYIVQQS
jgi:hypothetical protein